MMAGRRHRWGDKVVFDHKSERSCLRGCGTVKVTHHQPDNNPPHWVEYWRGLDLVAAAGAPVPPCEPIGAGA